MTNRILEQAKLMYFASIHPKDISQELKIPLDELGLYIFGKDKSGHSPDCWLQQKKEANKDNPISLYQYQAVKSHILTHIEAQLIAKMKQSAQHLLGDDEPLSLSELSTAINVVEKLDKITRLENGEATQHVQITTGVTLRDIANGTPIEAQYKEISDEQESDQEDDQEELVQYRPPANTTSATPRTPTTPTAD